jgi:ABC-type Fe3+/spermidine/putrescine transport system ATPase subunit
MIAGFVEPTGGAIMIGGREVQQQPPGAPRHRHGVPELRPVPHMTVFKNVAFGWSGARVPPAERRQRVAEALALVRLTGWRAYPRQLSAASSSASRSPARS